MKVATTSALVAPMLLLTFTVAGCNRTEPDRTPDTTASAPAATSPGAPDGRSDAALSTAVQAKYYTDDTIRGRQIDVSAENGVVTLRGTVESDAAKQQAVNLARSVEGVTNVKDELEVRQQTASGDTAERKTEATGTTGRTPEAGQPSWITTKIQAQYFTDSDIKGRNIDVTTASGGVVTLDGSVPNENAKNEAVRIARETEGVTRVEDRLRVAAEAERAASGPSDSEGKAGESAGVQPPDAWLTAKIQAKYFVDDEVKGRNIDVDTREGVVTLKGAVASEAEQRQAIALARNTDGVRDVTSELRIDKNLNLDRDRTAPGDTGAARSGDAATGADRAPAARPLPAVKEIDRPDPWITMKIQAKYFLDAEVKGHEIDVDTRNGIVTLKGRVDNAQQKQEAEQIARETEGVKRVNNQLTVGAAGA